jgi:hypothetical protein
MVTPQQIRRSGVAPTASQGRAAHPDVTWPNLLGPRLEERAGDESGAPARTDEMAEAITMGRCWRRHARPARYMDPGWIGWGATRQAIEPR